MDAPSLGLAAQPLDTLTGGDESAASRLMEVVYDELRGIAGHLLRGQPGAHTLQPTALVHEAYLRVAERTGATYENRSHFSALCAVVMRRILADHSRKRRAAKRGGDRNRVSLTAVGAPVDTPPLDALELDDALTELARRDERQARIVEYRYFAGMTIPEVAEVLGVSTSTVEVDWRMARSWLTLELRGDRDS